MILHPLDFVPHWFRTRWPLKRFYWQPEEVKQAYADAKRIVGDIEWD